MKTRCIKMTVTACLLALAGCFPERVTWSPDGQRAAVIGADGLHICDERGKLSPVLVEGATMAAWTVDSKRLVVVHEVDKKQVLDVVTPTGDKVETRRLATAVAKVQSLRVGSTDAVAYTDGDPNDKDNKKSVDLWVVSLSGGAPVQVDTNVALYPDWSPDGRSLVYIKAAGAGGAEIALGSVNRRQVLDDKGKPLATLADVENLAGMLMDGLARVRCLSDGRIIFSAMDITLPTTVADVPASRQLFALDPQRQATLTRLIPRSQESAAGDKLGYFEVSPDEKQIVFPTGEKATVSVLDLASGKIEVAQGREDAAGNGWRTLPVWRYPDELCFAQPLTEVKSDRAAQIVLRKSDGTERAISADWPDAVTKDFLDGKK